MPALLFYPGRLRELCASAFSYALAWPIGCGSGVRRHNCAPACPAPPRDCAAATRPSRPNGPARAANRPGHGFEIFGAVRVRMHITLRRAAALQTEFLRRVQRTKPARSLRTNSTPTISRVRRRAGARSSFPTRYTPLRQRGAHISAPRRRPPGVFPPRVSHPEQTGILDG